MLTICKHILEWADVVACDDGDTYNDHFKMLLNITQHKTCYVTVTAKGWSRIFSDTVLFQSGRNVGLDKPVQVSLEKYTDRTRSRGSTRWFSRIFRWM